MKINPPYSSAPTLLRLDSSGTDLAGNRVYTNAKVKKDSYTEKRDELDSPPFSVIYSSYTAMAS